VLVAVALTVVLLGTNGCYYVHIGIGQARILFGRESIATVLATHADLTPEERAKLALVPEILQFATDTLGLAATGSYRTFYDTGGKPVAYNVNASAKTSFTPYRWSFPFVGRMPYKGYFHREAARAEAARLEQRGFDTHMREVTAYSTLGWFNDPVFRRMLAADIGRLANIIFHELMHATVFRPGDTDFNESCATFVGNEGALTFLEARFGANSPEATGVRERLHDERRFIEFIDDLYARLDRLYRSDISEAETLATRMEIFEQARREFEVYRQAHFKTAAYAWFAKRPLNNAVILGYRTYHRDLAAFADVLALSSGDWKRTMAVFREAAKAASPHGYLADWRTAERTKKQ
jgi:predicted aminopeptidase